MSWFGPHPKKGTTANCKNCGNEIYCHPSNIGKKYCSVKCRATHQEAARINYVDGTAKCSRCKYWLPIDKFVKAARGRPHSYCKACSSEWFHERRGTPKEQRKAYIPAYRLTDEQKRVKSRELRRLQHVKRRGAGPAPGKFDIGRMLCMQDARCAYCRVLLAAYHIDHKDPVSRGGTNEITNLQLTCPKCNMRKGAMTDEEFLTSKRRPVVSWK